MSSFVRFSIPTFAALGLSGIELGLCFRPFDDVAPRVSLAPRAPEDRGFGAPSGKRRAMS